MPELPEAETIVRALAPRLAGRRILDVQFLGRFARRGSLPKLQGRTIDAVRRYGKHIVLDLDRGALAIRLGMTGTLLWSSTPGPYTRAVITTDSGALCYDDIRQFGFLRWTRAAPDGLGPDPLEITAAEFSRLLRSRRGRIKPLLLNQRFLRGLGNIYADEILFRAGIHPRAIAARLSNARALRLHAAMIEVLTQAIANGGSSVSDYVDADGRKGSFQFLHRVYRKTGQPCPLCATPVRRIVMAQRGTHFCPKCQRP